MSNLYRLGPVVLLVLLGAAAMRLAGRRTGNLNPEPERPGVIG